MRIVRPSKTLGKSSDRKISELLTEVSRASLRRNVETLSQPRHYQAEPLNNRRCAQWIADELKSFGYITHFQGLYRNVVAMPPNLRTDAITMVGAHYDSVPGTPGADDNASGVAGLLECARIIARCDTSLPTGFVAFNREEDGLLGSADFVEKHLAKSSLNLSVVHVLEMIGYCKHEEKSQHLPPGLPIRVPSVGNFIGVLGNRDSNHFVDSVLTQAATYLPNLPVLGLNVHLGVEKVLPVLARSDHDPFWRARLPAIMWTDTAEYRNPHYHRETDTPDTLDYEFIQAVTQLLLACLLARD